MIQPEELGLKLVLNSIFNKVPEDIVLCSGHAATRQVTMAEEMEKR